MSAANDLIEKASLPSCRLKRPFANRRRCQGRWSRRAVDEVALADSAGLRPSAPMPGRRRRRGGRADRGRLGSRSGKNPVSWRGGVAFTEGRRRRSGSSTHAGGDEAAATTAARGRENGARELADGAYETQQLRMLEQLRQAGPSRLTSESGVCPGASLVRRPGVSLDRTAVVRPLTGKIQYPAAASSSAAVIIDPRSGCRQRRRACTSWRAADDARSVACGWD